MRRDSADDGHALTLDHIERLIAAPVREQDHGRAEQHRHVVHRPIGQQHVLGTHAQHLANAARMMQRAVRVQSPLGPPGAARGKADQQRIGLAHAVLRGGQGGGIRAGLQQIVVGQGAGSGIAADARAGAKADDPFGAGRHPDADMVAMDHAQLQQPAREPGRLALQVGVTQAPRAADHRQTGAVRRRCRGQGRTEGRFSQGSLRAGVRESRPPCLRPPA